MKIVQIFGNIVNSIPLSTLLFLNVFHWFLSIKGLIHEFPRNIEFIITQNYSNKYDIICNICRTYINYVASHFLPAIFN